MITLTRAGAPQAARFGLAVDGFCWWYVDVVNAAGDGVVLICSFALPFVPALGRKASINLAVYEGGRQVWYALVDVDDAAVDVDGQDEVLRFGASRVTVARSALGRVRVEADLDVEVEGVATAKGVVVIDGVARAGDPDEATDIDGRVLHAWSPQTGPARGEARLTLDGRAVDVVGRGYHDRNGGMVPMTSLGIARWVWGRASLPTEERLIYALWPDDGGDPRVIGLVIDERGQTARREDLRMVVDDVVPLFGMFNARGVTVIDDDGVIFLRAARTAVLERGPFYVRGQWAAVVEGQLRIHHISVRAESLHRRRRPPPPAPSPEELERGRRRTILNLASQPPSPHPGGTGGGRRLRGRRAGADRAVAAPRARRHADRGRPGSVVVVAAVVLRRCAQPRTTARALLVVEAARRAPMSGQEDSVVVVGGGAGGLAAAIALAAAGRRVRLLERAGQLGGKIGTVVVDGVEADTGPSVLTLIDVVDAVFARAGTSLSERVTLVRPSPAFRYQFANGRALPVFVDVDETLTSVRDHLGARAADELRAFLGYARGIWEASKSAFVFSAAPTLPSLARLAFLQPRALLRVDPFSSMASSVAARVTTPELRQLLLRYATYNGSNPYTAPATLHCIAHVELALGGFGVVGGLAALARALVDVAVELGVEIETGVSVQRVEVDRGIVRGVVTDRGFVACQSVVVNADVGWLRQQGGAVAKSLPSPSPPSMSGATAIVRARRRADRVAHEVIFATDTAAEFADIFGRGRPPSQPTLYLCSGELAHKRAASQQAGRANDEALFAMVNVPALVGDNDGDGDAACLLRGLALGRAAGRLDEGCSVLWQRGAAQLARDFPGSAGSLYGAASNDRAAAFRRPGNRVVDVKGLYLASGSAHPGGGLPLCLQSGLLAADALLVDVGAGEPAQRGVQALIV